MYYVAMGGYKRLGTAKRLVSLVLSQMRIKNRSLVLMLV